MVTSFSGGGSRSTRREPPTLGKQLVNFITWGNGQMKKNSSTINMVNKTLHGILEIEQLEPH